MDPSRMQERSRRRLGMLTAALLVGAALGIIGLRAVNGPSARELAAADQRLLLSPLAVNEVESVRILAGKEEMWLTPADKAWAFIPKVVMTWNEEKQIEPLSEPVQAELTAVLGLTSGREIALTFRDQDEPVTAVIGDRSYAISSDYLSRMVGGFGDLVPNYKPDTSGKVIKLEALAIVRPIKVSQGALSRTTTDSKAVEGLVKALLGAAYVGRDRDGVGTREPGYGLTLIRTDGSKLPYTYLPSSRLLNLHDEGKYEWWYAPTIVEAITPLLPPKTITGEEAAGLAAPVDPHAAWTAVLVPAETPGLVDQIYLVTGLNRAEEKVMAVYLDPVSGQITRQDPPLFLSGAAAAVQEYFRLTAEGDYEHAWPLLHQYAAQPRGSVGTVEDAFLANQGKNGPSVIQVSPPLWAEGWKYSGCMCQPSNSAAMDITLSDGVQRTVHVATSPSGWGLFWSPGEGLR